MFCHASHRPLYNRLFQRGVSNLLNYSRRADKYLSLWKNEGYSISRCVRIRKSCCHRRQLHRYLQLLRLHFGPRDQSSPRSHCIEFIIQKRILDLYFKKQENVRLRHVPRVQVNFVFQSEKRGRNNFFLRKSSNV